MTKERENVHTLKILEAIEARSDVTQRHLADRLGVALGLANSYMKRCARKGLIKITQAPANRYLYYLTPKGFREKSRLTAEYLTSSFEFYREASDSMAAVMAEARDDGRIRVLFAGVSELAEIASVRAVDFGITIAGTYDPESRLATYVARPVWRQLDDVPDIDACIFTALSRPAEFYKAVQHTFSGRLFVPSILWPVVGITSASARRP